MAAGRPPMRLELAETSHKIKSAKMRSRAEMKLAMQTLDRQMRITRASSDMQQARMREHLEDLLLTSRRISAETSEGAAGRRASTAATAAAATAAPATVATGSPTRASTAAQRSRERPVVAPSLSEEHAFRERLLRRLQLLHSMRLPSNYAKRLLSEEEQMVIDLGATASPENVKIAMAVADLRPRTCPCKPTSSKRPEAARPSAEASDSGRGHGRAAMSGKLEQSSSPAAADAHGAQQASGGSASGKVTGSGSGSEETPTPRPSPPPRGLRGGRSARSGRRSAHSSRSRSARAENMDGESGGDAARETQPLMTERLQRFYDSLRALRRLSMADLLLGLRHRPQVVDASSGEQLDSNSGHGGDADVDEATFRKECRDLLGYCGRSATSLTWKTLAKAL